MAGRGKPAPPRRSVRSQKKNQTTLQFSRLPSSSPAKANYSHAVQDRLASVRYRGSRGQSAGSASTADEETTTLPTPEPSSQCEVIGDSLQQQDGPNSIPSSPLTRSIGALQEDGSEEDDDVIVSAKKRRKIAADTPTTDIPSSPPPRRSSRFNAATSSPIRDVGVMSSRLSRRSGRLSNKSSSPPSTFLRIEKSHGGDLSTPTRRPSPRLSDLGSAESTDDDDLVMISKPTQRSRRKPDRGPSDPFIVNDDRQRPKRPEQKTPRRKADDFIADDDSIEYVSSDNEASEPKRKSTVPRSSAKHSSRRAARRRAREEQEELEEDLHDLQDSDNGEAGVTTRTRGGPVTTERDRTREHFDLLRRRRAGEKVPRIVDSDDGEGDDSGEVVDLGLIGRPTRYISEQGSAHSSVDTDQELIPEPVDDEDDFIEDDSTGRLARPHPDIPLQFTSFASAKPRELFPHIIEWLVKNKIAPAFSRDDELYTLAFSRVDAQVKTQAGSRLISAAWGTDFKNTILARPTMKVVALPGADEDNIRTCDACNRVNHPARYEFKFSGEPYYQKTLEPVDMSSSDDEDDEERDNDATYDEQGHLLPSEQRRFYLGRFCAANAEMGHKLTHWKYHLNESLMAYLEEQGVLSADAVVARDKMNKKQREKQAESIVDSMQETGVIADLWADFENDLNDARLGMEDFDKKGGRSKGRVGAIRSQANGTIREWSGDKYRVTRVLESDSEGD
ncbi:hypothetical protein H2204_001432 [Knufia peltigerae]|uniref:DUF4211 domain-containing protein n=1 Tax=Knufia peltigerae TaxID=1002370 RepID=A0AA39D2P4_9EURO|nr:hypothetical protein H2204_001432 [Knufia peltigerae]